MQTLNFPQGFLWGAATASYQIEGAANEDGRGPSIWDTFSHTPGMVANGDTGDVACDHYHRWAEDVALMARLGVKSYRFSIAWPRILPQGAGAVNPAGIDFYSRLVDALLEAGITPMITLYHWDLPQTLQDKGGWLDRRSLEWFADYAGVTARALGDRVKLWTTLNEPWVSAFVGYFYGNHAPGRRDPEMALQAAHHLLAAHGQAVGVLRSAVPDARVGIVLNTSWAMPASESPLDQAAARLHDGCVNRWFLDPLFKGSYPKDILDEYAAQLGKEPGRLFEVRPGDMQLIGAPLDFLGFNYYFRTLVRYDENAPLHNVRVEGSLPVTDMGWDIYPQGLQDLLEHVHRNYFAGDLYVTENGAAFRDTVSEDGKVHDPQRVEYYRGHLAACWRTLQAGVPLKGYYAWSLLDNFEWSHGYSKRFGLVYVDYPTQQRIVKDSGEWYAEAVRRNAVEG